jgi:hypothetical protein
MQGSARRRFLPAVVTLVAVVAVALAVLWSRDFWTVCTFGAAGGCTDHTGPYRWDGDIALAIAGGIVMGLGVLVWNRTTARVAAAAILFLGLVLSWWFLLRPG